MSEQSDSSSDHSLKWTALGALSGWIVLTAMPPTHLIWEIVGLTMGVMIGYKIAYLLEYWVWEGESNAQ